jgi:hypothetical protein
VELALTVFNVGAGVGILAVGVAVAYLAWRVTPLIAETRALTNDLRRLTRAAEGEDAAVRVARLAEAVDALDEVARRPQPVATRPDVRFASVESTQTPEGQSHL